MIYVQTIKCCKIFNIFQSVLYSRMYQFFGDASGTDSLDFQPLFADYENNPGTGSKLISKFCTHVTCCYKELFNYIHALLFNHALPTSCGFFLSSLPSSLLSSLIYLSIVLFFICCFCYSFLSLSPSTFLPFIPAVQPYACLSAHLFVHPSICPSFQAFSQMGVRAICWQPFFMENYFIFQICCFINCSFEQAL